MGQATSVLRGRIHQRQLPPTVVSGVFDDPVATRRAIASTGPFRHVAATMPGAAANAQSERIRLAATKAASRRNDAYDAPLSSFAMFRGTLALNGPVKPGAEAILQHPVLIAGAREDCPSGIVRPYLLLANLMVSGVTLPAHADTPNFRGMSSDTHPGWLLVTMLRSGLFDEWYQPTATAVAWLYDGPGGEFEYWQDGPANPPAVEGALHNKALIGDNSYMYHRVRVVGSGGPVQLPPGDVTTMALEQTTEDTWRISAPDGSSATLSDSSIRISLLWKALVFADEAERRRYDEHEDDLTTEMAVDRLMADLSRRGIALPEPGPDPLQNEALIEILAEAYPMPELASAA